MTHYIAAATVEGTSNSRESNDTVEHALSTERLTTPPGEWSDTCDFTVKSPSIDCNDGSCSVDSPSVDCAENLCSVESLLKDVHELVMMAAKNSHQRERLISCEKGIHCSPFIRSCWSARCCVMQIHFKTDYLLAERFRNWFSPRESVSKWISKDCMLLNKVKFWR